MDEGRAGGVHLGNRIEHYCAFCSLIYRSYKQRSVGAKEFFACSLFASLMTWLIWGSAQWFGFLLFFSLLGLCEVLIRVRWRASTRCCHCGFDPVLYKKSPDMAAERVKEFLDQRRRDPSFLLRPQPVLPVKKIPRGSNSKGRESEIVAHGPSQSPVVGVAKKASPPEELMS